LSEAGGKENGLTAAATVDDAVLLAGIARGREQDMTEFYRLYHGRICAFVLRQLGNAADAADVANEVMLEVWRGAGHFEGRARALTWVLGIAHHKAVDRMRRSGYRAAAEGPDPDEIVDEGEGTVDLLARLQEAELVKRCLDRLPDTHRMVVHLAFYEDLGYREIASILRCPEGTVKTRIFHAKKGLRRCLGESGIGLGAAGR
jgi:RNA polymerase sigma-70 factor (ECF subfamily)